MTDESRQADPLVVRRPEESSLLKQLRFLHFGMQCPHHERLVQIVTEAGRESEVIPEISDFSGRPDLCKDYHIYSPTLLVVNGRYRWNGPFNRQNVLDLLNDAPPVRPLYAPGTGTVEFSGELVMIAADTVEATCETCFGADDRSLCRAKSGWVSDILRRTGLPHLGFLNMDGGRCVGGAEFLPIEEVPYPIPGGKSGDAFITCSYATQPEFDFKSQPLRRLLAFLKEAGFRRVFMVASMGVVFPNGPMEWYLARGFNDLGKLAYEEDEHAELHLLCHDLIQVDTFV